MSTADGREFLGRVTPGGKNDPAESIRLHTQDVNAEPVLILKEDLEEMIPSPISQMPKGLLKQLSEEELLDSWDRYLEEHRDELVAQYKGKYVAIWNDTVYDSDEDLGALAERVYTALGYRSIFMPYIGEKERVSEFTTPL